MAFLRYAKSSIVKPKIFGGEWDRIRVASGNRRLDASLKEQAERILGESFTPDKYLLTHSTIVCSVDVETPTNVKTGALQFEGEKINRRFADYVVKADCDQYINNNLDCWSRGVLQKSYKSFIGAHNFVEHIQVEELSKGKIIDAVLRDIGDSLYVDILVATNKKHTDLVQQIISGQMNAMSMGCFVAGSQVTLANGKRIAIEEIQPGENVLTHTGNIKEVLNKQMRRGVWNMRTIKVQGIPTPITATDNHPFFVVRPFDTCQCGCGQALDANKHRDPYRKLSVRYLKGHHLNVSNPSKGKVELPVIDYNVVEVRADEIKKGDLVFFPKRKDTQNHISNGKARLLGYFLAEGSFLKYKGEVSAVEFSFSLQEKDTFVKEVSELMLKEFGKETKTYLYEESNGISVRVHSKEVAQWFKYHGGEYSDKKVLSDEVMTWSNENHLNLLGAFINGDGTLHKIHGNTSLTSCSEQLVYQFHTLLANSGIQSRLSKVSLENRKPSYTLIIGKIQAIALKGYTSKVSNNNIQTSNALKSFGDKILYKVDNVKEHEFEGWVYDLEIEDDHSYIVNGVSVHNCSVDYTICTKCGNVASDETEMCKHIKYEKGNVFYDEKGNKHRVAELCGHESEGDNGGVTFIEASWVATPAFKGAVARNTLDIQKVASQSKSAFDFGDDSSGEEGDEEKKPAEPAKSPIDELEEHIKQVVMDRVKSKLEDELSGKKEEPKVDMSKSSIHENDSVIKEGNLNFENWSISKSAQEDKTLKDMSDDDIESLVEKVVNRLVEEENTKSTKKQAKLQQSYFSHLRVAVNLSQSNESAIKNVAYINKQYGVEIPNHLYRLASYLGSTKQYGDVNTYLATADTIYKKPLTDKEQKILVRLAKILSLR